VKSKDLVLQSRDKINAIYIHTMQRTYFRVFGHPVDQRFAIIGNARTGSNFLLDGLKSSPSIKMYHEIFAEHNRKIGTDFDAILSTLFQYESKSTELVGFKLFYNHLTDEEWNKLLAYKDLKVIHLTRRNRLRTIISLEIAFKTGEWTRSGKSEGSEKKRLILEPSNLIKQLEQIEERESATRARFRNRQIMEVVYEKLIQSPTDVFASVSTFLGVNGIDPSKIRLKKQNPESLKQLIINYYEIKAVLRSTRFAEYLDD
jgi:LPS sulfotransferase NodH